MSSLHLHSALRLALLALAVTISGCVHKPPMEFAEGCSGIVTHSMVASSGASSALARLNVAGPLAQAPRGKLHANDPLARSIDLECRSDDFLAALPQ
jgi:hypothetical protein